MEDDTNAEVDKLFNDMLERQLLATPMMNSTQAKGRKASLTRAQAQAVKEDMRPYEQIASSYGVSKETVMRVKRTGRYKNIPYIPSDVDPAEFGYRPRMSDYKQPVVGKFGRPFKSGRPALTDEEIADLLNDPNDVKSVAQRFRVSTGYVRDMRKKHKIAQPKDRTMPEDTRLLIALDPRQNWMIARDFKVPEFIVERIKARHASMIDDGEDNAAD